MDRVHDYSRYLQQCEAVSEQIEHHLGEYKKIYINTIEKAFQFLYIPSMFFRNMRYMP
jgi:hypothetical protein